MARVINATPVYISISEDEWHQLQMQTGQWFAWWFCSEEAQEACQHPADFIGS